MSSNTAISGEQAPVAATTHAENLTTKPTNIGAKRVDTTQPDPMELSDIQPAEQSTLADVHSKDLTSASTSDKPATTSPTGVPEDLTTEVSTKLPVSESEAAKDDNDVKNINEEMRSTKVEGDVQGDSTGLSKKLSLPESKAPEDGNNGKEIDEKKKSTQDEGDEVVVDSVVGSKQKQGKRVLDSDSYSDSESAKGALVSKPVLQSTAQTNEDKRSADDPDEVAKEEESKLSAPNSNAASVTKSNAEDSGSNSESSDSDSSDSDSNTKVKKAIGAGVGKNKPRKLQKKQHSTSSDSESDESSKVSKTMKLKKSAKSSASANSSGSSSSSSSSDSDSDSDSKDPKIAQKKGRARKTKRTKPAEPLPDPSNLEKCSTRTLSGKEIKALPSWAYLIVEDKAYKRTWRLPVRDKTGMINKPLLAKVRQALISGKDKGRPLDARITNNVFKRIEEVFRIAWPGVPLPKLAAGLMADEEEEYDMEGQDDHWLSATQSLRQGTQDVLKDLGADGKTEEQEEQERLQQEKELRQRLEKEAAEQKQRENTGASLVAKMRARRSGKTKKRSVTMRKKTEDKEDESLIVFELSPAKAVKPRQRNKKPKRATPGDQLPQSPNARRRAFKNNLLQVARNHLAEKRAIESGFKTIDAQLQAATDFEDNEEALLVEQHESDEEQKDLEDKEDLGSFTDQLASVQKEQEEKLDRQEEKQEKNVACDQQKNKNVMLLATPQCTDELNDDGDMDVDLQEVAAAPVRTYSKKALDASKRSRNNDVTRTLKSIGVYPPKQVSPDIRDNAATDEGKEGSLAIKDTSTSKEHASGETDGDKPNTGGNDESATAGKADENSSEVKSGQAEEPVKRQELKKNKSNAMYRALLERENQLAQRQRRARSKNVLEDEASEEEDEDDGVGDYGLGRSSTAKKVESDLGAERVRKEDLEAIVDTISDDEGEDAGDGIEYHQKLMKAKEEEGLKKLQDDVENHRIAYKKARRRERSSRLDNALDESSDDESTDEEVEMARQERYRSVDEERRRLAASGGQLAAGESLEDVENEIEQREQFLQAAKMHKKRIKNKKGRTGKASGALLREFIGEENTQLVQRIRRCNTTLINGKAKSGGRSFLSQTQRSMTATSNEGFKLKTLSSKVVFLEESSNENVQANKKRKCENHENVKLTTKKKKKASGLMRALTRN